VTPFLKVTGDGKDQEKAPPGETSQGLGWLPSGQTLIGPGEAPRGNSTAS